MGVTCEHMAIGVVAVDDAGVRRASGRGSPGLLRVVEIHAIYVMGGGASLRSRMWSGSSDAGEACKR